MKKKKPAFNELQIESDAAENLSGPELRVLPLKSASNRNRFWKSYSAPKVVGLLFAVLLASLEWFISHPDFEQLFRDFPSWMQE